MIKYVVFKGNNGFDEFITFSDTLTHKDFKHLGEPLGAGFVKIFNGEDGDGIKTTYYKCFDESVTLGIQSRPIEDSEVLNLYQRD